VLQGVPITFRCVYWLSNYVQVGDDPHRADRDARFIYNHWWNAPIFIWLAEAIGVDQHRVRRAAEIASSQGNSPAQAAAIRRILPWSLIARQLTRSGPRDATNGSQVASGHFVAYHNGDEQGPYYPNADEDRTLHGAACHGCLLVAETSCEARNLFLDRALMVDTVGQTGAGFF
jgi:hypothetical protein